MHEFTFGEIEAALARVNHIATHKRVAFAGRLRILQKNGVPMKESSGRGNQSVYSLDHALQMALGVELLQCGLSPQRAADMIKSDWWTARDEVLSILKAIETTRGDAWSITEIHDKEIKVSWIWLIQLEELSDLSYRNGAEPKLGNFRALPISAIDIFSSERMAIGERSTSRALMINAARLIGQFVTTLCSRMRGFRLSELIAEYSDIEPNLGKAADRFVTVMEEGFSRFRDDKDLIEEFTSSLSTIADDELDLDHLHSTFRLFFFLVDNDDVDELKNLIYLRRFGEGYPLKNRQKPSDPREAQFYLCKLGILRRVEPDLESEKSGFELTEEGEAFARLWAEHIGGIDVDQEA